MRCANAATHSYMLQRSDIESPAVKEYPMLSYLLSAFQRWRQYRATIAELSQLSDRELQDLGIARSDIAFVAHQATSQN